MEPLPPSPNPIPPTIPTLFLDVAAPTVPLEQVLRALAAPADWDLLLIGDGSGSLADMPSGSAVVLIDRREEGRRCLVSGFSCLSIGNAELWPYLHALIYFHDAVGRERINRDGRPIKVFIVTDSELIAHQGRREWQRKTLAPLWAAVDQIASQGYDLHWRWVRNDTVAFNSFADYFSVEGRLAITRLDKMANQPALYSTTPLARIGPL